VRLRADKDGQCCNPALPRHRPPPTPLAAAPAAGRHPPYCRRHRRRPPPHPLATTTAADRYPPCCCRPRRWRRPRRSPRFPPLVPPPPLIASISAFRRIRLWRRPHRWTPPLPAVGGGDPDAYAVGRSAGRRYRAAGGGCWGGRSAAFGSVWDGRLWRLAVGASGGVEVK